MRPSAVWPVSGKQRAPPPVCRTDRALGEKKRKPQALRRGGCAVFMRGACDGPPASAADGSGKLLRAFADGAEPFYGHGGSDRNACGAPQLSGGAGGFRPAFFSGFCASSVPAGAESPPRGSGDAVRLVPVDLCVEQRDGDGAGGLLRSDEVRGGLPDFRRRLTAGRVHGKAKTGRWRKTSGFTLHMPERRAGKVKRKKLPVGIDGFDKLIVYFRGTDHPSRSI